MAVVTVEQSCILVRWIGVLGELLESAPFSFSVRDEYSEALLLCFSLGLQL